MKTPAYKFLSPLLFAAVLMTFSGCGEKGENHRQEETEEPGHSHDGAVMMEPDEARKFGIKTEKATPGIFSQTITVSGQIEPAPSDRMTVTARRSGIATIPSGIVAGKAVKSGTVIASISSRGIQGGDPNAAAMAAMEGAKKELERLTPLYKEGLVTASTYNEAERAYKEAAATAVPGASAGSASETAPCDGTITDIFITPGQYVETGAPIAVVARNSRLTLRADVPERHLASIPSIVTANFRPDHSQETFSLESLDGKRIAGAVAEARNGYIPVYFSFTANGETLPGAFAEIYLKGVARENVLSVPKEALIEMQGNKYLYVCQDGHAYEKRLVATGASDGMRTEIISGVKEGESVVVKGATVVRMAETSAIAPPAHNHNH